MRAAALAPTETFGRIFAFERRLELCLLLTLLLLLLYPDHHWYIKIPLSVLVIAALVYPRLRASTMLWAAAVVIIAAGTYNNWYAVDNHKYLLGYWCLAIFFAFVTDVPERTLETSARWMTVLVFWIAVAHKTMSPDYLSGSFFYYELLMDSRFSGLATHVGGLPDYMRSANDAARHALVAFDSTLTAVRLESTPPLSVLANIITWWNYLIQAVIGLAFALPRSGWFARTRHMWLLLFLFTTYLFAPVIGFGWVLGVMGIAQTQHDEAKTRAAYVLALLFLQVYRTPWGAFFSAFVGPDSL